MMRRLPWLAALVAAIALGLAVWRGQVAERRAGAAYALLDAAGVRAVRAERRADSLATVYRTDTLRLWRLVRSTDTLTATVDVWKHDTLRVVEYVERADSTITACVATVRTCEARLAAADSLTAAVRDSVRGLLILRRAPRTAVGVAWDARLGAYGLAADRDWGRVRLGGTVTPGGVVARMSWWW